MKNIILEIKKLTDNKWLNLFSIRFQNSKRHIGSWLFASRKENPISDTSVDVVVIIPTIDTSEGKKLVMIKEWRWAVNDYVYAFPAGLVDPGHTIMGTVVKELKEETGLDIKKWGDQSNPVYASPGLSDESSVMVFVEASGTISTEYQEKGEDIEVLLMDVGDIEELLGDEDKKVGAKAWGVLFYYMTKGKIE